MHLSYRVHSPPPPPIRCYLVWCITWSRCITSDIMHSNAVDHDHALITAAVHPVACERMAPIDDHDCRSLLISRAIHPYRLSATRAFTEGPAADCCPSNTLEKGRMHKTFSAVFDCEPCQTTTFSDDNRLVHRTILLRMALQWPLSVVQRVDSRHAPLEKQSPSFEAATAVLPSSELYSYYNITPAAVLV